LIAYGGIKSVLEICFLKLPFVNAISCFALLILQLTFL